MSDVPHRPVQSVMSRRRYDEIARRLSDVPSDTVAHMLSVMCEVLHYDPDDNAFSRWRKERLQKLSAETHLSMYELGGGKRQYHRHKTKAARVAAAGVPS